MKYTFSIDYIVKLGNHPTLTKTDRVTINDKSTSRAWRQVNNAALMICDKGDYILSRIKLLNIEMEKKTNCEYDADCDVAGKDCEGCKYN